MAKRKIKEEEAVEAVESTIEDLTELGEDVAGLEEIEVTEVESILEDAPAEIDLIEEETCETESDQSEDEEKASKSKSENEKKSSDESKPSEESTQKSSEPQPNVRSVKPTTPKENPSLVREKTAKIETEFSQNAQSNSPKKQETQKPRTTRVAPSKANTDGTMRSTFGIFHR